MYSLKMPSPQTENIRHFETNHINKVKLLSLPILRFYLGE